MTASIDPFESPKILLERATELIGDFERASAAFIKESRWVQGEDLNRKTLEKRIYMTLHPRVPGRLRGIASDIVNNVRHALDQAVSAASAELGAAKLNRVYFPFSKSAADLPAQLKYRCSDVPSVLADFLCSFQPYLGGDDVLWALSRMAGPNKHQVVLAVGVEPESVVIHGGHLEGGTFGFVGWDAAKQEIDLGTLGPEGHFKPHLTIPLFVALGNVEVVGGQLAAPTFDTFVSKARRIVSAIEAETARLVLERAR